MSDSRLKKKDFQSRLLHWYSTHHRKLPWRKTRSPYKIWISEVMLQQTTVQAVIPYFRDWLRLFPDIKTLSQAPLQKVLKAWQGLGYYQRAKNLHKASQIIMEQFGGTIPSDYNTLKSLPGFGPYTASAVLSLVFDMPYSVLDANVRRVLMRLMRFKSEANPRNDKILRPFLVQYFPERNSSSFNQAMMELGALVCRPKNPLCLLCPITEFCRAYESGEQEVIPFNQRRKYQKIEAVLGIIKKQGKYLIQKRPSQGLLADLWEFPGGKRKESESLKDALYREIHEELQTEVEKKVFLTKVNHSYTQFQVTLHAFECQLKNRPRLKKGIHRWSTLKGLRSYPFASGSAKIIRFLEEKYLMQGKRPSNC